MRAVEVGLDTSVIFYAAILTDSEENDAVDGFLDGEVELPLS